MVTLMLNTHLDLYSMRRNVYICLGGVLENMKIAPEKAERYYKVALEKDPGNPRAIEALKKLKSLIKR